jgi:Ser/Thr protein kinase RdoA (MazF antagonist)
MPADHSVTATGAAAATDDVYTGFTAAAVLAVLGRALGQDAGASGWRLLRPPADNAIVHLPEHGLIARIGASPAHRDRLARELAVAAWLADRGIPTVTPAAHTPLPQLETIDGRPVTWWTYVPSTQAGSSADLGQLLAALHRQREPWPSLPVLDPWARIAHQIGAAEAGLPAGDVDRLQSEWERLREEWDQSAWGSADPVVVHGDAYTGNTLVDGDRVVLLDFEDTVVGPLGWDLAAVVGSYRLGWTSPAQFAAFRAAYGEALPNLGELDLLSRIILFRRCCWLVSRTGREPAVIPAARQRVSTLHLEPEERGWTRGGS